MICACMSVARSFYALLDKMKNNNAGICRFVAIVCSCSSYLSQIIIHLHLTYKMEIVFFFWFWFYWIFFSFWMWHHSFATAFGGRTNLSLLGEYRTVFTMERLQAVWWHKEKQDIVWRCFIFLNFCVTSPDVSCPTSEL